MIINSVKNRLSVLNTRSVQNRVAGIPISELRGRYRFLLRTVSALEELTQKAKVRFYWETDFGFMAEVSGLKLNLKTLDDLTILNEVFIKEVYNFELSNPVILLDIGMHKGIASLLFSKQPQVREIYSFEPFVPTYEAAKTNFDLNSKWSEKIRPHCFGLSDKNGTEVWEYFENFPSCSGCWGPPAFLHPKSPRRAETVRLRQASEIIESIERDHEGVPLVVKMDCEGSEFKILADLKQRKKLRSVSQYLLEWHRLDPKRLIDDFKGSGFTVVEKERVESASGPRGVLWALQ